MERVFVQLHTFIIQAAISYHFTEMLLRGTCRGERSREREIEKWEQSRELGFKLGFVSFFLFPVLGPVSIEVGDPQVGEVTCGGSPQLSCKRDQIKMRDYYGQAGYPT